MSHEIDFTKGVAAIAYVDEKPWHGYGQKLAPKQPLDIWLPQAGMNYEVREHPIFYNPYQALDDVASDISARASNHLNNKLIKGRKALTRSDTHGVLSIVSEDYHVVQPKEILEFFRSLIDTMGFEMDTAGVLAGGKRVWALAKIGKEFTINGDKVEGYLLLATSYDGKFSTTAQFTSVRVVCNNTLSWSLGIGERQNTGVIRIPHSTEFNADQVKGELGLYGEGWKAFEDNVIKLVDVKVSKRQAVEFFLELLGVDEDLASGRQLQSTKKLIAFYESGPGSDFITSKNTTWGLVNAVSYFTDHGRRAQNNGTRFNSASFGPGAKLKRDAMAKALALVDAA